VSTDHHLRKEREDHRNEFATRRGRSDAPDPAHDQDYFRMMRAVNDARQRYWTLPPTVHTDDPRTAIGRVAGAVMTFRRESTYNDAVQLAALALNLVAAVDCAESVRVDTGGDAA
jgi:hypothetical protein